MRWQDVKDNISVFTSNDQSRKLRKAIPPLMPMPTSTPRPQETRITLSRADDGLPMEVSNVPELSSLQGDQNGVDCPMALDAQPMTESAAERDENDLNLELLGCFLKDDANNQPVEKMAAAENCSSTASKRKSASLEVSQLCPPNDVKRRSSCNLEIQCSCRKSQSPGILEMNSKTTQTNEVTNGLRESDSMSIVSLLNEPRAQATADCPLLVPYDRGNDGLSSSFSGCSWTEFSLLGGFEIPNNQAVKSPGADFNETSKRPDAAFFPNFDIDWLDFPDYSTPEYVIQDTTMQRSAPSSLSSNGFSDDPKPWTPLWNPFAWQATSTELVSPYPTSIDLSLPSIIPSTPESFDAQHRSSAKKHRKSPHEEPRYLHPCPFNHCARRQSENGFKRKDHLVQHLRVYHSLSQEDLVPGFCPHKGCCYAKGQGSEKRAFLNFKEYSKHLKDYHEESLFNCSVPGCRRKGANGYSGQANLLRHVKRRHPLMIDKVMACQEYSFAYLSDT